MIEKSIFKDGANKNLTHPKEQKGITLIALIITIIVLLILAVLAIRAVQDEGIIRHALDARNRYDEEKSKEKVMLALNEWKIAKELPNANFSEFLTGKFGTENVSPNEDGTYTVIVDGYGVIVDTNGEIIGSNNNDNNNNDNSTDKTITAEEIETDDHLYAIGATVPTYVVAKFNEDYTQVNIIKNGEESDGVILSFVIGSGAPISPMTIHADTLKTAIIEYGIIDTGKSAGPMGLFYNCRRLTSLTIAESVTNIGASVFSSCTGLTSVIIPGSVTNIEVNAFNGCTGLTSVTIQDGVETIGRNAFDGCAGLTSVTIPGSITSIGQYAFSNCTSLTSVEIQDGAYLGDGSGIFSNCTSLTSVTIPGHVTNVPSGVFSYCTGLTNVTIQDGVETIGDSAFFGCTALTSVTIPSSVTDIGDNAFFGCTGLTSVTIPSSVTDIGDNAFWGCTGLVKVKIFSTELSSVGNNPFGNLASNSKIYVLSENIETLLSGKYSSDITTVELVTLEQMKNL